MTRLHDERKADIRSQNIQRVSASQCTCSECATGEAGMTGLHEAEPPQQKQGKKQRRRRKLRGKQAGKITASAWPPRLHNVSLGCPSAVPPGATESKTSRMVARRGAAGRTCSTVKPTHAATALGAGMRRRWLRRVLPTTSVQCREAFNDRCRTLLQPELFTGSLKPASGRSDGRRVQRAGT
jgi:hypothetical protein